MSNRPMVWMNVTTSLNWQRPPVGIVRVEKALSEELRKYYGSRFKECVWQDNRFIEARDQKVAQSSISSTVAGSETLRQEGHSVPWIYPILPRRKALALIAQGILSISPYFIKPHINKILYYSRFLLGKFRNGVGNFAEYSRKEDDVNKRCDFDNRGIFEKGDILISVGLDWDNGCFKSFYGLRKNGVKVVSCCYDLIPVLFPQYCVGAVSDIFKSYFIEVADGSDLIFCISRQTERDLVALLDRTGAARPKTQVFQLGDSIPRSSDESVSDKVRSICQEPFVLFVSTIERRKNHEVLYRAYHLLCDQGNGGQLPKMVFVGMPGWGVSELLCDIDLDPMTKSLIIRLDHVSDTELEVLYEGALFCVFPSLYEGWGLPVGEALSLGKAVICSDKGSLPEVGGDLVVYADPWNPKKWADEILRMSTDSSWRLQWEKKVRDGYKMRTWSQAGKSVYEAIEELYEGSEI